MNRALAAARLHLIGWQSVFMPWGVMFSALVVNFLIFGLLRAQGVDGDEASFTGGLLSFYIALALVFVQAVNRQLAFAMNFSLTRRAYLLGTTLFALGMALGSSVLLYLLRLLEVASDGWWMQLDFFQIGGWNTGNPITMVLAYAAPMLALSAIGALYGSVFARWGTIGTWVALITTALVIATFVVPVTYAGAWTAIGHWFAEEPITALLAGYPSIVAVVFGAGSYLVLRRVNA